MNMTNSMYAFSDLQPLSVAVPHCPDDIPRELQEIRQFFLDISKPNKEWTFLAGLLLRRDRRKQYPEFSPDLFGGSNTRYVAIAIWRLMQARKHWWSPRRIKQQMIDAGHSDEMIDFCFLRIGMATLNVRHIEGYRVDVGQIDDIYRQLVKAAADSPKVFSKN